MTCVHHYVIVTTDGRQEGTCKLCGAVRVYGNYTYTLTGVQPETPTTGLRRLKGANALCPVCGQHRRSNVHKRGCLGEA